MGELGPEMVVSNGRYFIVGQNGPEFVDLAEDAIVFIIYKLNHYLKKVLQRLVVRLLQMNVRLLPMLMVILQVALQKVVLLLR